MEPEKSRKLTRGKTKLKKVMADFNYTQDAQISCSQRTGIERHVEVINHFSHSPLFLSLLFSSSVIFFWQFWSLDQLPRIKSMTAQYTMGKHLGTRVSFSTLSHWALFC